MNLHHTLALTLPVWRHARERTPKIHATGILVSAAGRLAALGSVLSGVSLITFLMTYLAPGDKAAAIANARYPDTQAFSPEILEAIREEFSLNEPFFTQFFLWLSRFLQGDFGNSFASNTPVWDIFLGNAAETLTLTLTALVIGLLCAFILSSVAAWRPGSLTDRVAVALASIGAAMPNYWLGLLLILLFAATLNWLPAYGTGTPAHLVLPALTLAFWITASQTRLLRSFFPGSEVSPLYRDPAAARCQRTRNLLPPCPAPFFGARPHHDRSGHRRPSGGHGDR